ncbi:MAG: ABC transporter ATP-binding protein [Candidatus Eisenbacteria bacterium]
MTRRWVESARLYLRILAYLIPHTRLLVLVVVLNFLYIAFNAASIWMIAPFLSTLFARGPSSSGGAAGGAGALPAAGSVLDLNNWMKQYYLRWVARPDPLEALQVICVVIFVTFLLKNVFQFSEAYLVSFVEQRVIKKLRDELYEKILAKPLRFFDRIETGNLISRITNDINALNVAVNRSFTKVIRDPILIVTFLLILFSIDWRLTLLSIVVIPVSGIVIHAIGQSLKRKSRRVQERIAEVTSNLQETLTGIRVVQAFSQEGREARRFRDRTQQHFLATLRQVRMHRLSSPLSETLGVGIMVAVLWYGGHQVLIGGGLSAEDFVRFLTVLFAMLQPLKSLAELNNSVQIALASGQRVFEIIDHPLVIQESPQPVAKSSFDSRIDYEDVSFRYGPDGDWALRGITFAIRKGEKVALVGSSGAGKSTIANLLPRFYDVDEGRILIDGVDIRTLRLKDLRGLVGVVSQEVVLFNDTVANNIAYGQEDIGHDRIERAAQLAHASDFIRELPAGYATVVGEKGLRLSGGERQRLSIARALLKNPPILIFDEATSSLDSESERLIQEAVANLLRDRTVLMIAHRLSSVIDADRILVFERGALIDTGSHHELLERSPRYRHFYELQFTT